MAHKARHSQSNSKPETAVVLFGVDANGKPKAARFREAEAALVAKAAKQLHLRVLTSADPAIAALAAELPAGRIHANGRGLVPTIRTGLYTKLVAVAGPQVSANEPAAHRAQANGDKPGTKNGALPKDWDAIARGHIVVAQDSPTDGWYEAIVVDRMGDICTLRWRDWPRYRSFTRHRRTLALLCPDANAGSATKLSMAVDASAKTGSGKPAVSNHKTAPGLPKTWDGIDVDSLVLAKEDGPWRSWWEAIPTEKHHGDTFTLRWRDYKQLPMIKRARVSLALLCPTAK
jgi:hypothetical protein